MIRCSLMLAAIVATAATTAAQAQMRTNAAKLMPALEEETDLDPTYPEQGKTLNDLLGRETFYREIGPISKAATSIGRKPFGCSRR